MEETIWRDVRTSKRAHSIDQSTLQSRGDSTFQLDAEVHYQRLVQIRFLEAKRTDI